MTPGAPLPAGQKPEMFADVAHAFTKNSCQIVTVERARRYMGETAVVTFRNARGVEELAQSSGDDATQRRQVKLFLVMKPGDRLRLCTAPTLDAGGGYKFFQDAVVSPISPRLKAVWIPSGPKMREKISLTNAIGE